MLFSVLIAVLGISGSIFAFSTAVKSGITPKIALAASLSVFCTALFLCTARFLFTKRGDRDGAALRLVLFTALFLLALIFIFRKECTEAIMGLAESLVKSVGLRFTYKINTENTDYLIPSCIWGAAAATAVFYTSLLRRNVVLFILLTLPLPIALICAGQFPAPISLCTVVAATVALSAYNSSERIYTGFFALSAAVICMVSVNAFVKQAALPYINNRISENNKISEIVNDFRGINNAPQSYTAGAIRHGELSKVGKIRFTGKTVLRGEFPKTDNTIYLRGFIGYDYYDNKWNEISGTPLENEREVVSQFSDKTVSPLLMDGANIKSDREYPFKISDLTTNSDYLYLPYTITPGSGGKFLSPDKTRFVYSLDSYGGSFYGGIDLEVYKRIFEFNKVLTDENAAKDEQLYRDFVYENYLGVPDVFRGGEIVLDENFVNYVGETDGADDDLDGQMNILSRKLYFIKNWLRDNCAYNLDVDEVPEGVDFVNRFLEDTRAGSCSHFASAAVLLCRSAGIPARYVEGYIIKPKDFPADSEDGENTPVEIPDTRAHAWAEIYIDEFGWYPYEFTSGYGNIRTAVTEPVPEIVTEATTVPNVTETAAPETTIPPITTPAEKEEIIADTEETKTPISPFWSLLIIIPAVIAFFPLRRSAILKNRAKKLAKLSPSQSVFYAYYEVLPILGRYGLAQSLMFADFEAFIGEVSSSNINEAESLVKVAVNTAFGGYEPTETDKTNVISVMKSVKTKFYNSLSKKQQFREKYFRVFL
jgi:hypothetical protein